MKRVHPSGRAVAARLWWVLVCGIGGAMAAGGLQGEDAATGIRYSVRELYAGNYQAEIVLPTRKVIKAVIDDTRHETGVVVQGSGGGSAVALTPAEIGLLRNLAQRGPRGDGRLYEILGGLLAWLNEAPAGVPIDTGADARQSRISTPATITSLCGQAGQPATATYTDASGALVSRNVTLSPCYDTANDCLGRCGEGCTSPPAAEVHRVTQDCLDHDQCTRELGTILGACKDEWIAAVDDFLSGQDCASFSGAWVDGFGYRWNLAQSGSGVRGSVDTGSCGVWVVAGAHTGSSISLTATIPGPQDACCNSFTYTGGCAGCDAASGTWVNECALTGSWSMSRAQGARAIKPAKGPSPTTSVKR